jgi:hypothetical protein
VLVIGIALVLVGIGLLILTVRLLDRRAPRAAAAHAPNTVPAAG